MFRRAVQSLARHNQRAGVACCLLALLVMDEPFNPLQLALNYMLPTATLAASPEEDEEIDQTASRRTVGRRLLREKLRCTIHHARMQFAASDRLPQSFVEQFRRLNPSPSELARRNGLGGPLLC